MVRSSLPRYEALAASCVLLFTFVAVQIPAACRDASVAAFVGTFLMFSNRMVFHYFGDLVRQAGVARWFVTAAATSTAGSAVVLKVLDQIIYAAICLSLAEVFLIIACARNRAVLGSADSIGHCLHCEAANIVLLVWWVLVAGRGGWQGQQDIAATVIVASGLLLNLVYTAEAVGRMRKCLQESDK